MIPKGSKKELSIDVKLKSRRTDILVVFLLISSLFFISSYTHFIAFDAKTLGKYFPFKWVLAGHITGGAIALLIGPVQFLKGFRNKYRTLHRILGRVYLFAILISGVLAFVLTLTTTTTVVGLAYTHSLQALIFAWFFTSYTAFATILKRQVTQHQQWMTRSYICTFAFVIQNYLLKIPVLIGLGTLSEIFPTMIWLSWSVPLLVYQKTLTT